MRNCKGTEDFMAQAILRLEGIKKDYKVADSTVHALKGVSLAFRKKEFVSVLGHSGCGKTTLLNIIGGLDHYTDGDLIIKGVSTKNYKDADWDAYRNHSIGFVFQSYNLIPHQSVLGNVELALTLSGVSAQERRERAANALRRVGLGSELNKKPNQLSGGQMQRVAIARALVNNPEILLADEPTGALDTETSVQIMDLIKEIAGERLVIMVTHNPELARRYSTRIVELKDGEIVGDSDPFVPEDGSYEEEDGSADVAAEPPVRAEEKRKNGRRGKTSMTFWTAFLLSGRNLLTKKARTLITSIAGSIGIISVCLVLALSSGFSAYITRTEEDMLSYYPVEINETALDVSTAMSSFMNGTTSSLPADRLEDRVYINSFLSQLAQGMTTTNDLSDGNTAQIGGESVTYLQYLQNMPEELYNVIQYGYGVSLSNNLFVDLSIGSELTSVPETPMHMSLSALREYYTDILTQAEEQYSSLTRFVDYFTDVVNIMPGTADLSETGSGEYVQSQYDVFGRFPQASDEAVIVIGSENDMTDLTLAQLGFLDETDFLDLFLSAQDGVDAPPDSIPFYDEIDENGNVVKEGIIGTTFNLYYNDSVYRLASNTDYAGSSYRYIYDGYVLGSGGAVSEENGMTIEVVGVLRLKDGLTYGCLTSGLNLTEQLINEYMLANMQSAIVQYLNGEETVNVANLAGYVSLYDWYMARIGGTLAVPEQQFSGSSDLETVKRSLGGDNTPNTVSIYAKDFETKAEALAYLDEWNVIADAARQAYADAHGGSVEGYTGPTEVKYTDTIGLLMSMVETILDAITYVLVAFTGISLVVSTVMIGVITYVSVVERTKEIGILRAIGARKKDIKRVFNAETFIIGLCAGLIGVLVAYLLQIIINVILMALTGIAGLASLQWYSALVMVVISVALTLISGLVPASAAAKRDPVVALRTE